jgi:type 1 glutamine amidotransferase
MGERKPLQILLVAGPKDHGPGEHDYPAWQSHWHQLLDRLPGVTVHRAFEWPSAEQWQSADLVACYFWNHRWSADQYADLDRFLARGGGLTMFHSALVEDRDPKQLARRIGLSGRRPELQFRHGPLSLEFQNSPAGIAPNLNRTEFVDEVYWNLVGEIDRVQVVAQTVENERLCPMAWTYSPPQGGRVFVTALGHFTWTFNDPIFRVLALRGMAWAADEDLSRFESAAIDGIAWAL